MINATEQPKHSRRSFIRTASTLGAGLAVGARPRAAGASRPNILYIMTDQQHAGMLSCTGNRWLKTPAMDSLAAEGVRFERAYSSNPVCVPARTSMMTGRYPSYFGIRDNRAPAVPREALATTLGHVFRGAGYRTIFGGKTHWPRPMSPESIGFEYLTADERDGLADACAAFLRQPHERPFLLVASFINPHDICYMAIDAYTKANSLPPMYPKSRTERERVAQAMARPAGVSPREFFERLCPPLPPNHRPTAGEPAAFARMKGFRGYVREHWSQEDWRLHRWAYCRLTERVDAEIGRVLAVLRETGLDRETVVILSSDHGDMDAAHGFEHKSLPYEESARVPFIVSWKGRTTAGRVDRQHLVCASVDLFPTLCDYAGIAPPPGLQGASARPIVERGAAAGWREDLVIEGGDWFCLRSRRYKYTAWEGEEEPREMLIDMERDPGEMKNLSTDPALAGVLLEHRRRLRGSRPAA